jgi:hypothetical protein
MMHKLKSVSPEEKTALLSGLPAPDYGRYLEIFEEYGFTPQEYQSATERVILTDVERIILTRWACNISGSVTSAAIGINRSAMQIILQQARLVVSCLKRTIKTASDPNS